MLFTRCITSQTWAYNSYIKNNNLGLEVFGQLLLLWIFECK